MNIKRFQKELDKMPELKSQRFFERLSELFSNTRFVGIGDEGGIIFVFEDGPLQTLENFEISFYDNHWVLTGKYAGEMDIIGDFDNLDDVIKFFSSREKEIKGETKELRIQNVLRDFPNVWSSEEFLKMLPNTNIVNITTDDEPGILFEFTSGPRRDSGKYILTYGNDSGSDSENEEDEEIEKWFTLTSASDGDILGTFSLFYDVVEFLNTSPKDENDDIANLEDFEESDESDEDSTQKRIDELQIAIRKYKKQLSECENLVKIQQSELMPLNKSNTTYDEVLRKKEIELKKVREDSKKTTEKVKDCVEKFRKIKERYLYYKKKYNDIK